MEDQLLPVHHLVITGLGIGEDTTITITAINCGNQIGTTCSNTYEASRYSHTKREVNEHIHMHGSWIYVVPAAPSECSVLPVYTSVGDLNAVHLTWAIVNVSLILTIAHMHTVD